MTVTTTQNEDILNEVDLIVKKARTLVGTILPERVNREAIKCFGKLWKHKTIGKLSKAEFTNLKLSAGDLRYQCAWQGELVTQNLFKLDGLDFDEGSDLKQVRKQLVCDALEVIRLSELLTTRVHKVQSFIEIMKPELDSLSPGDNSVTPADKMEEVGPVDDAMQVAETPQQQQQKEEERLMEESEENLSDDKDEDFDKDDDKIGSTVSPASEMDSEVFVPEYVVREYADRLVVVVDLPQGVNEEDVEVSYDGGILSVKGEVQRYVRLPQSPWGFTSMGMAVRSTPLLLRLNVSDAVPTNSLNTAHVSASFKRGALLVTFPKKTTEREEIPHRVLCHSPCDHVGGGAYAGNGCRKPDLRYRHRQPLVGSSIWGQSGQRSPWTSGFWGPAVF